MKKQKWLWLLAIPIVVAAGVYLQPKDEYLLEAKYAGMEKGEHEFVVSMTNEGRDTIDLLTYDGGTVDYVVKDKEKVVFDSKEGRMSTQVITHNRVEPGDTVDYETSLKDSALPNGTYDVVFKVDKDKEKTYDVKMKWVKE